MSAPHFQVGQLVHHKLYGYRGVIYGVDPAFDSTDEWYDFQTQGKPNPPPKDAPWYHVLVDGAQHTTYVAERNLEPDPLLTPVQHPFLDQQFKTFFQGRYHRDNLN